MINGAQFVAGGSAEVRVLNQYLDGELYLVDDTLSVGLVTRPKFQVRNIVVESVAVFMMHAFEFSKRATEMFRHYIAMLQNFAASSQMDAHVSRRVEMSIGVDRAPRAPFVSAFTAAVFLLHVVSAVRATVLVAHKAALRGRATILALKSRWLFAVHEGWLPLPAASVKEIV